MDKIFIIKGDFYDCSENRTLQIRKQCYCIVKDGISLGVYHQIPASFMGAPLIDYGDALIMPGMIDLHIHAPQYAFRGIGMELELLEWLYKYTFPEESKFSSYEYADKAYSLFAKDLKNSPTTRAVIFGTIHREATLCLMRHLEGTGLITEVGKVNMDRNAPDYYIEDTQESLRETKKFLEDAALFERTSAILTPRFIPTCSDELMAGLGKLQRKTGFRVQSHLSENRNEIQWVKELCPKAKFYGDAYDQFGLFGGDCKTIMAHCISSSEEEVELMRERGVFVAHCPNSNINLSSGIAPIQKYLSKGLKVGLGTDLAAGYNISIFDEMVRAVQVSKMRWRYISNEEPLTMMDAFYIATRGGGEFFGRVGSFDAGFEFDALVIDDFDAESQRELTDEERLFRSFYLHHECKIKDKYVRGQRIYLD